MDDFTLLSLHLLCGTSLILDLQLSWRKRSSSRLKMTDRTVGAPPRGRSLLFQTNEKEDPHEATLCQWAVFVTPSAMFLKLQEENVDDMLNDLNPNLACFLIKQTLVAPFAASLLV